MSRRHRHAAIAVIVAIAVLLRLPSLLCDGLWRDEANVYVQLIAPSFGEFIHRVTATEWHPPLFFLIMYPWAKVAGTSELTLKVLPFIFSVATVPVVYHLGKTLGSSQTGLLAGGLYAIAPLAVTYSSEYLYPLMGLLCTLLALLVTEVKRSGRLTVGKFIAVAAVTLLVMYTHYIGLLYVPMLILWVLASRLGIRTALWLTSALFLGAFPFVLWLPVFLIQRHIGVPYRAETTVTAKASFFAQSLVQFVPARPLVLELLFLGVILVAVVALVRSASMKPDACILAAIFLALLAIMSVENQMAVRYVLPLYGPLCVFLASVIAEFGTLVKSQDPSGWSRFRAGWVVAVLSAVLFIGDAAYAISNSAVPKSGIRSLLAGSSPDPATLYIIAPDYLASTFAFYSRNAHVIPHGFVRWEQPEFFRLSGYSTDWSRADAVRSAVAEVVSGARHYKYLDLIVDDYAQNQGEVPYGKVWQLLKQLEARYQLVSHTRFPGRYEAVSDYRFLVREV